MQSSATTWFAGVNASLLDVMRMMDAQNQIIELMESIDMADLERCVVLSTISEFYKNKSLNESTAMAITKALN